MRKHISRIIFREFLLTFLIAAIALIFFTIGGLITNWNDEGLGRGTMMGLCVIVAFFFFLWIGHELNLKFKRINFYTAKEIVVAVLAELVFIALIIYLFRRIV